MSLVCQGTSCENTVGDVITDVFTYGLYAATVIILGYAGFAVPGKSKTVLSVMFYLLIFCGLLVAIHRYRKWRKRVAAMHVGIARLEQEHGSSSTEILPVSLLSMKFRSTSIYTNSPNEGFACAICLDQVLPAELVNVLSCTHCFHKECLRAWASRKGTCPNCRCKLSSSSVPP